VAKDSDLRVERLMQDVKTRMGRRVCRQPEKVIANSLLLEMTLRKQAADHPEIRDMEAMIAPKRRCDGPMYDTGDDDCILLGRGRELRAEVLEEVQSAAFNVVADGDTVWTRANVQEAILFICYTASPFASSGQNVAESESSRTHTSAPKRVPTTGCWFAMTGPAVVKCRMCVGSNILLSWCMLSYHQ
jgi:hypothetical protein